MFALNSQHRSRSVRYAHSPLRPPFTAGEGGSAIYRVQKVKGYEFFSPHLVSNVLARSNTVTNEQKTRHTADNSGGRTG